MSGHGSARKKIMGVKLRPNWGERVAKAAAHADTSQAEWLRGAIRKALDSSERMERERLAKERTR